MLKVSSKVVLEVKQFKETYTQRSLAVMQTKIELLDLEMKKIQLTIASKTGVNSADIF